MIYTVIIDTKKEEVVEAVEGRTSEFFLYQIFPSYFVVQKYLRFKRRYTARCVSAKNYQGAFIAGKKFWLKNVAIIKKFENSN